MVTLQPLWQKFPLRFYILQIFDDASKRHVHIFLLHLTDDS
jgi:hypothetical protein